MLLTLVEWFKVNYANMFQIIFAGVALAEVITRITPTEKDDGFVKRLGSMIDKVASFLKIPNNVKKPNDQ